ncbi:YqhR family membrane protein [Bacillus sp. B15-48]|uniref:YqhR family membrane protein n=1 Tax=Bacillus sp. B15-48 TaxID=1548601 RepID=UPI00193F5ED8|nr:YqhR family membrane protein [Bacillus sp. B15-48]MBM4762260.1 hypothetical protein [Bacillus sp. B15-48]
MEGNHQRLEQNQREKPLSFISIVIITGFVGGVLWSSLALLAHYFNFTDIRPNMILEPWALGDWKRGWIGTVFSLITIGLISIGAALLYYALLRKFDGFWVGLAYGLGLFFLVFYVLNPIFPGVQSFWKLSWNTLITTACFYLLYGVFIGYSISFEESERGAREELAENGNS